MADPLLIASDVVAVAILAFGLYFPRYRRRDIMVAIVGFNVGVLAVAAALSSSEVTAAIGFGLFGVLSIIRLRSSELDPEEVAYYFSALAMGLLGGVDISPLWLSPALMALIIAALAVADHPAVFPRSRYKNMTLDRAFTDEAELTTHLESLLAADVQKLKVKRVDLVNDSTSVDVRYRLR